MILATKIGKEKEGTKDWSLGDTGKDRGWGRRGAVHQDCLFTPRQEGPDPWVEGWEFGEEFLMIDLVKRFWEIQEDSVYLLFLFIQSVKSLTVVMS